MLIAKSDKLISIVTKLVEDMHILKSGKGVPITATSPVAATPPVATTSPIATTPFVDATLPPAARVPVDATTATPSYENTPNMTTTDGYWYNSNEGVPNDENDGNTHSSLTNEDNSIPMEMDEVVGIISEPSDASVVIKAPMKGKYKGVGK